MDRYSTSEIKEIKDERMPPEKLSVLVDLQFG
jgi:hypothetical protein